MRQYAGFGTAEETNKRFHYLLSQGITGLSVAFDLPTQMGMDSDHPLAAGEVGRVGVAIVFDRGHGAPVRGDSSRPGHHLDDDQLDRRDSPGALCPGGEKARRRCAQALGHHPERHPEGIHRPRDVHLSAAPRAAHHHRCIRLGWARAAGMEHDLDQRVPHPRSGLDRRSRKWLSPWPTPSLISRRRSPPDWRSTTSPRGFRSSSTRTTISSRRSRSIARRGGCTPS